MYSAILLKSRKGRTTKTSIPQEEVQYTAESMSVSIDSNELLNSTLHYSVAHYHTGQTSSTGPKALNNTQPIKPAVAISNEKCKGNEAMMSTCEDNDVYEAPYN